MNQFLEKYQQVPVEHYPHKVHNKPMVSVCVQAYQHAPFITECLDSILMQKTDFDYEILLGEDASTDGTREICIEYAKKYPDKIKLFLHHRENNIVINGSPTGRLNFLHNLLSAQGKYIALCEGDDYWTDPLKLQKQVDFLEEHEEYGVVHGDCHFYYHKDKRWKHNANKDLSNHIEIRNKEELFYRLVNADYKIRTATALFRKKLLENRESQSMQFLMGDTPMWLDFSQVTQFKYFDEVYAVYRLNEGSVTKPKSLHSTLKFQLSGCIMRFHYCEKYNYEVPRKIINKYNRLLLDYSLLVRDIKEIENKEYIKEVTQQKIDNNLKLNPFIKTSKFYLKYPKLAVRRLF